MKKLLGVVLGALVIALALWVALRVQQANRQMKVSELLPKTTVLLAHLPDLQQTRQQWHESDLYALWHEPSVQAWLQDSLARFGHDRGHRRAFDEFLQLNPTDTFLALGSMENNEPRLIGGFHFEQPESDARKFIQAREAPLLARSGSKKREIISYRDHQIETVNAGGFALATVFDRNWFFVSNDLEAMKGLLDRADRRTPEAAKNSLRESELYQTATKQLPMSYAGMFFVDPQAFVQRLMPLLTMSGNPAVTDRLQQLKQIRCVSGTMAFDHGKMHENTYVGMPERHPGEKLKRPALATVGGNAFLYSASLASWPEAWRLSQSSPPGTLPPFLQQFAAALRNAGISQQDFGAAFGDELEIVGTWPQEAHWPQVSVWLPVKDSTRARKILGALAGSELFGASWTRSENNGVSYLRMSGLGGFVPVNPTIALTDRMLIAASDSATVEAAVESKGPPTDLLENSDTFKNAQKLVAESESAFNYIDTRLLFERADAALRPLLLMSATIYPALGKAVDIAKLPPAEAIVQHLSPIVMSQRYTGNGYLTESAGPITFNEAAVGLMGAFAATYMHMQDGLAGLYKQAIPKPAASSVLTPSPSATPTPSSTPP